MKMSFFAGITKRRLRRLAIMAVGSGLTTAWLAYGQTASELLEKAIYTEETKGDLPGAASLYEQALKEAKTSESLAAQALYRLGLVHLKQGNAEKAAAVFKEIVEKYPGETELVAAAKKKLPAGIELGPAPWTDGEDLVLHFRFPAGLKIGVTAYRAVLGSHEGRPAWVVGNRVFAGANGWSAVHADPDSFRPLRSFWKHSMIGEAVAEFREGSAVVKNFTTGDSKTIGLAKPVFDNEQVVHMMRRLPLAVGYKTTFDIITTLGGGTVIPVGIEVVKEEEVPTPAGKFNAFRVDLAVGGIKQSFWYSTDQRRLLVKMDAGGVIGELVEVRQLVPGAELIHKNAQLGFQLSAPGDWLFFDGGGGEEKHRIRIALLDPRAEAHAMLFAFPIQSLLESQRSSLKAWAEARVKEGAQETANFKVRPDSWKDLTISGYPAISFVADLTEGPENKPRINYSVVLFRENVAAHFFFNTDPDKLDSFREQFDPIVKSFRTN